jgi:class 3 adenylate cyclase/DNA-binding beta-propeller fold protein YncE
MFEEPSLDSIGFGAYTSPRRRSRVNEMREAAQEREATQLPTGTVTFLFMAVERSTDLLEQLGERYVAMLAEHHRILRTAVLEQGGREIDNEGDSFFFAFERADAAVAAAVLAQRALAEHAWPEDAELRVRMGLHTGEPIRGEERYVGLGVHRAARIGAVAHGGQIVLSNATRELVEDGLAGVSIRDLGVYRLNDLERDERLYQVDVVGLRSDFPPLRALRVGEPLATSQSEVEIGAEFLGYRIEELIGRGGMGVVYRAYDLRLKRTVALKLVTPALALDERFRERFTRETELAMSLEHPNVVPIYDAGEVAGRLYLAMRLVQGTDLRQLLREESALDPGRALAICRQVANALDAAHARRLVHRDVKPSNVLLDENEHVYLADFGLTRRLEEQGPQAGDSNSIGTPAYVAPEQIEAKSVDARADVYSLGCVLFECLTGRAPYLGESQLALAWAHLEEEPPSGSEFNPELPEAIDPVIRTALAKEPEDRYSTCGALVTAAARALGQHQVTSRRRRLLLLAALVGVIALAAVLLVAFVGGGKGDEPPPALYGRPNTVVHIDPRTRNVSAVIEVGERPTAVAAYGSTVWVYNHGDFTVSEVDAGTDTVRSTTQLSAPPIYVSWWDGPVIAADATGAWVIGVDARGKGLLTRLLSGGRGKSEYPLRCEPRGVAVGAGTVWVVCQGPRDALLRIDARTGRIERTTPLPSSSTAGIGFGAGAVWVVASRGPFSTTLYRIDTQSGRRIDTRLFATVGPTTIPRVESGSVWIATTEGGGTMHLVNPRTLADDALFRALSPDRAQETSGLGAHWALDRGDGVVVRFNDQGVGTWTIRVTRLRPIDYGDATPTSIAVAADGLWVTVARY